MPLIYKTQHSKIILGVWEITENNVFFSTELKFCATKKSVLKNQQYMASRLLLSRLDSGFIIGNIDELSQDKPSYLDNRFYFNVAHSGSFAVAILSNEKEVGIDVEVISKRIVAIKSKFLNQEELGLVNKFSAVDQIDVVSLFWTVKEAVLKWTGDSAFDYLHSSTIQEYSPNADNTINVKVNYYETVMVKVRFFKIKNYWVSYCV
jgi:phosphopantetheinyl transferase